MTTCKTALFALLLPLSGCMTFNGVCAMMALGNSDSGVPFTRVHCERDP